MAVERGKREREREREDAEAKEADAVKDCRLTDSRQECGFV